MGIPVRLYYGSLLNRRRQEVDSEKTENKMKERHELLGHIFNVNVLLTRLSQFEAKTGYF